MHGYGMGSFKIVDRQPKGLLNCLALLEILLDLKGNHLRVGGDVAVDPVAIAIEFGLKLLIVIDIAVETGMNDAAILGLFAGGVIVYRMTICFRDGTYRRPA